MEPTLERSCLRADEVLAWLDGKLSKEEAQTAERHVDACKDCRAMLANLARARTPQPGESLLDPTPLEVPAAEDTEPGPGRGELDEYQFVSRLGRGGMGEVWLAHDLILDRFVALKVLQRSRARGGSLDSPTRDRFLIEARAAARLQHPNVATIHRAGFSRGRPYLISEYIRGRSLAELAKPVAWRRVLTIARGLIRGLAASHRAGVLHRDLKPGNVMLADDGTVKLVDFGLAKLLYEQDAGAPVADGVPERSVDVGTTPDLTAPGALLGTPLYMAPESWMALPATKRTDVYSTGAVLYELCTGETPFGRQPMETLALLALEKKPPPPLGERMPDIDPRFAAIVDRCLEPEPLARFASAEELLEALDLLGEPGSQTEAPPVTGNPYRGLQPFDREHRALFFGRAGAIRLVLERLVTSRLVVVAGGSGVGKSSLCRAGVLPRIEEGALGERRTWTTVVMTPGARPMAALAHALESAGVAVDLAAAADDEVRARALARALGARRGLVLFVDALEELCTLAPLGEAGAAASLLCHLATMVPGMRVLAAARIDLVARLAALPVLGAELPRAIELLGPPTPEGLRDAVTGPARATGVDFEDPATVETLVESMARAEGGLPVLQFALAELWERRDVERSLIPRGALESIGGVVGALARHADATLASLDPPSRESARAILLGLVTPERTGRRRRERELVHGPSDRRALDALVAGRLVTAGEIEGEPGCALAHEALLTGWGTLGGWLDEQDRSRWLVHRLELAATEWIRSGRHADALWGAARLAEIGRHDPERLPADAVEFLIASRSAVRRARLVRGGTVGGVLLLVAVVWAAAVFAAESARERRVVAYLDRARDARDDARADEARLAAARREAFAAFDGARLAEGERRWQAAGALEGAVEACWARASRAVESALAIGTLRAAVERLGAEILFHRALAAERRGDRATVADLLSRLALYDRDGRRRAAWSRPARLTIRAPGAREVRITRVAESGPRRAPGPPERHTFAEVEAGLTLAPGSYVIEVDRADAAPLRHPVLLARGEDVSVDLPDLGPARGTQADRMVWIAPGRFLFGTSADEVVRRFANAVPLHVARTPAYGIARTEITFGDWIEFLSALPDEERVRHTPRTAAGGLQGSLALERDARGVWSILLQPVAVALRARQGEPVRYPARARNAAQSWERLPVAGITPADLEAYAGWLRRTNALPGARACTELEWERAARGADDRIFPHGDELTPDDADYDATYGKDPHTIGPDEVGRHPHGRSPFGIDDMAGNVWEWTRSVLEPDGWVLRGGAYYYSPIGAWVSNREPSEATLRDLTVGARLCADP